MRIRFWIGLSAVLLIAVGSVVVALIVRADDQADFHRLQHEEAIRAAHQAESVAGLSVGQLTSAAAFFQAEGTVSKHEFEVVGRSLLHQHVLNATAFVQRVPLRARGAYERSHGFEIIERAPDGALVRAATRGVYFPLTYVVARSDTSRALGYDLGSDPKRAPYLRRATDSGHPVATPVEQLLLGGMGLVIYRPVYRDGAPIATVAERRAALIGFTAGGFRADNLAAAANAAVSEQVDVQLRAGRKVVIGPSGELDDADSAPVHIADRTWLLVVHDPAAPSVYPPLLLAVVGIAVAALLGSLILVWSRNERMQELQREASEDPLTGLKNRRRFEEDLQLAMARARREGTTGALLMLDLDYFKRVNDTHGHPTGDRLIVEIAAVLERRTRASDSLARLGGDEFAVVLPRCTSGEAQLAAEAIAAAIRDHQPEGETEPITASVGIAMFGDHPRSSIGSVVSEADSAMYAAKDGGRDGVRVFDAAAISSEPLDAE